MVMYIYSTNNMLYVLIRFHVESNWFNAKTTIMRKCQMKQWKNEKKKKYEKGGHWK